MVRKMSNKAPAPPGSAPQVRCPTAPRVGSGQRRAARSSPELDSQP